MKIRTSAHVDDETVVAVSDYSGDDHPDLVVLTLGDGTSVAFALQGPLAAHRRVAEEYLTQVDAVTRQQSLAEELASA